MGQAEATRAARQHSEVMAAQRVLNRRYRELGVSDLRQMIGRQDISEDPERRRLENLRNEAFTRIRGAYMRGEEP